MRRIPFFPAFALCLFSFVISGFFFAAADASAAQREDLPDLYATISGPSEVDPGQDVSGLLNVKVMNVGTAPADEFSVRLYLSLDDTVTEQDIPLLDGTLYIKSLDVDETVAVTFSGGTIPGEMLAGSYYLGVVLDELENIEETREDNNSAGYPVRLSGACPDLNPALVGPSSADPGENLEGRVVIKVYNTGERAAERFTVGVFLSQDEVVDENDTLLDNGRKYVEGMEPNDDLFVVMDGLRMPVDTEPGLYYLIVAVDDLNEISECNEYNNIDFIPLTVVGDNPDCADLIPGLAGPNYVDPGGSLAGRVSVHVGNAGEAEAGAFSIGLYLSKDEEISTDDTFLEGSRAYVEGIAARLYTSVLLEGGTIPGDTTPGIYYLGVIIDEYDDVSECREDNNTQSSPVFITGECPDLTVSLSGPSMADPGENIKDDLSVEIQNIGAGDSGTFSIGLYLSSDATITTGDTLLTGGRSFIDDIASGSSLTMKLDGGTIPANTSPGDYYLGVLVDELESVSECSEVNNTAAYSLTVLGDCPDLYPELIGPSSANAGQDIKGLISLTVTNAGTAESGSFSAGLYLSADKDITQNDTPLTGARVYVKSLAAGASTQVSFSQALITGATPSGSYYLGVILDELENVAECKENNNTAYAAVTVAGDCPNLKPAIYGPGSARAGQDILPYVKLAVENTGSGNAGAFAAGLYLSQDAEITPKDSLLAQGRAYFDALDAGQSMSGFFDSIILPADTAPGSYYLGLLIDELDAVSECDESDNYASFPVRVEAAGSGKPDLSPEISGPSTAATGDDLSTTITLKVHNNGSANAGQFSTGLYLSPDATITSEDTLLVGGREFVTSLKAGGTTTVTLNGGQIPSSLTPGQYYLGVYVDELDTVDESNETNNTASFIIKITGNACTGPNLRSSVSGPTSLTIGAGIAGSTPVAIGLVNDGTAATGPFFYALYISTDATIDSQDILLLGGRVHVTSLPQQVAILVLADNSITVPPSLTPGNYYLGIIADDTGMVTECDETDNTGAMPVSLVLPSCSLPDLLPVIIPAKKSFSPGEAVGALLDVSVANAGDTDSGDFSAAVYLSTDETITSDDTMLTDGQISVSALKTFDLTVMNFTGAAIPKGIASGHYYLGVLVDNQAQVSECKEDNNSDAETVVIGPTCNGVDLAADLSGVSSVKAGGTVKRSLIATLHNLSDTSAGPVTVGLYLSPDETVTNGDTPLLGGTMTVTSIAAQSSVGLGFPDATTVPSSTAPGQYYLGIVADSGEQIGECDETNNYDAIPITVEAASGRKDYTGWWYTPGESGTGLSMEIQNDILFLVWYVYDAAGNPAWYVSWAGKDSEGRFSGDLRRYTGWELGEEYSPASYETIGKINLVFSDADHGILSWNMDNSAPGSKPVEKYLPTLTQDESDPRELTGWWIAPGFPGNGIFIEARGDTLFLGWYHFRADGGPRWWTMGGFADVGGFNKETTTYMQPLQMFTGGQAVGGQWKPIAQGESPGGAVLTVTGTAPNIGVSFSWGSVHYDLERYTFNSIP